MGYRSDVVALFYTTPIEQVGKTKEENDALNKRNQATLDMFVRENFPKGLSEPVTDYADGLHRDEADNRVVWKFQFSDVKWYESYPEVQAFDAFWEKFCELADESEEEGDPVCWACEFIRIGENDDDIETKASNEAEWLMQVQRSIELNY